jgi:hypothetical protein
MMKIFRFSILLLLIFAFPLSSKAAYLLLPMDNAQKNHLKSYGIAFWSLENQVSIQWLLNYRGGSFLIPHHKFIESECIIRGVSFEVVADARAASILQEIADPEVNMDAVKLEKAPKVAVYSPKSAQPWDDAVTLVLTYAEIPYDVLYDDEIIQGKLNLYDWLHLHHEDFTGQYGKFYANFRHASWYQEQVREFESTAKRLGFSKVSELKLGVAKKIRDFTIGGGFLFAMCSATDTYDIALSAEGLDICEHMFDGDPSETNYNSKIDFSKTFAFRNYSIVMDPMEYEHSNIDASQIHLRTPQQVDLFTLFEFSAKWDPIPTMLNQNHEQIIKGFMGQTTAFYKQFIKPDIIILGENKGLNSAKYIHGKFGNGTFTFYGGHDPEDYQHYVGDPPTDLNLHSNSPGYRLILNNILFPAAKKIKQKT